MGRLENDGFHYLGRIDRQTKIRGYRVELLEIEGALRLASAGKSLPLFLGRMLGDALPKESWALLPVTR